MLNQNIQFSLEERDYIQLNQLLKFLQLVENGAQANLVIDKGLVYVNKQQEFRRRNKLYPDSIINYQNYIIKIIK